MRGRTGAAGVGSPLPRGCVAVCGGGRSAPGSARGCVPSVQGRRLRHRLSPAGRCRCWPRRWERGHRHAAVGGRDPGDASGRASGRTLRGLTWAWEARGDFTERERSQPPRCFRPPATAEPRRATSWLSSSGRVSGAVGAREGAAEREGRGPGSVQGGFHALQSPSPGRAPWCWCSQVPPARAEREPPQAARTPVQSLS